MTKEEFINMLSESDNKLSKIKSIKEHILPKDANFVFDFIIDQLSKEEIMELVKDTSASYYLYLDTSKLIISLGNENIIDFITENRKWLQEKEINISDITIKMNPNQQVEFVRQLISSHLLSTIEMCEVVALMSQKAKSEISIDELPDECKEAYKVERYEGLVSGNYRYGKIKVDLDGDLSRYRGLDRLICLGGDNTDFEKMKRLIEVCPKMKVHNDDDGQGYQSTADEYIIAKEWIDRCISQIPEDYTVLQKIALVDNMIGKQFCFSPDYGTETFSGDDARAVWKVIANKKGVCFGIAKVEEIILKRLGVDVEIILSENQAFQENHAFLKINGLEIKKADGTIETGNSIIDPTWNLATHRFRGRPTNFLVSYEEIRRHDILPDGRDRLCHKNDRALSDATLMLDEQSLTDLYRSIGVTNENGIFPIAEMDEMSDNMNEYKRNNPQENIAGQLRILRKFCPEFNSCISESMHILRKNLLNKENMGVQRISVSKIHSKHDADSTPLICVYAMDDNENEMFFVADKESKGFKNHTREEFLEQFERFQADIEKNGKKSLWDRDETGECIIKIENEYEGER